MKIKVISNSTPLIALSKINRIHILKELFGTIVIPNAVYCEVAEDPKKRNGSQLVSISDWILRQEITNHLTVDVLAASVDLGEAEAITLVKELHADLLLIDDKAGRKVANLSTFP